MGSRTLVAFAVTAALLAPAPASAGGHGIGVASPEAAGAAAFVPGEVLVRYRDGAPGSARAAARTAAGAAVVDVVGGTGLERLRLAPGESVEGSVAALRRNRDVAYAQPNYIYRSTATPNDTHYDKQYGLHNTGQSFTIGSTTYTGTPDADIDAPEAWDLTTGSDDVVVAVVDTGVDLDHPDLQANLISGYDWVGDDSVPDDANGHGTHVAGIIGARTNNNTGVSGINWNVKLMPLRVLNASGVGTTADIAAAFTYAADNGADIVNASLGAAVAVDTAMRNAILGAPDTLFVVAAGNDGNDVESQPSYPCVEPAANVICVAATDEDDDLASFSNHGKISVDLAAPGVNVASTYWYGACGSGYCYASGTSMATPMVAGAAALYLSMKPCATVADLRAVLLDQGDAVSALKNKTVTAHRLNLRALFDGLGPQHTDGLTRLTEAGDTDSYTLRLACQPASDVTVTVNPGSGLQVDLPAGPLVFTAANWATPQTVQLSSTLTDDGVFQGSRERTVTHTVASADPVYDGMVFPTLHVAITDHEDVDPAGGTDFTDDDSSIFEADIEWLAAAGITVGCSGTKFCPRNPVTRGHMAAFLTRALVLPPATRDFFHDDDGSAFEDDINRLAASGITLGCSSGRYCASRHVTRGQMAAFLDRALGLAPSATNFFSDDDTSIFEANINALRHAEITTGCTDEKFCPGSKVNRGQMAAFLRRALG